MDSGALWRPNGSGHLCGLEQQQQQNSVRNASHCWKETENGRTEETQHSSHKNATVAITENL